MTLLIVPTDKEVPLIQDIEGTPAELAAKADLFFRTAQAIAQASNTKEGEEAEVEVTEKDRDESRAMFLGAEGAPNVPTTSGVAMHLKALVTEYDHQVLESNIQARNYIVNRLLDISNPGSRVDVKTGQEIPPAKTAEQIRALELLGKVSEIGLFTERIEVNINSKSTEELESELVQTLSKYLNVAEIVPEGKDTILDIDLDEELGRKPDTDE